MTIRFCYRQEPKGKNTEKHRRIAAYKAKHADQIKYETKLILSKGIPRFCSVSDRFCCRLNIGDAQEAGQLTPLLVSPIVRVAENWILCRRLFPTSPHPLFFARAIFWHSTALTTLRL